MRHEALDARLGFWRYSEGLEREIEGVFETATDGPWWGTT
jgi:hypothetical protein